jgi:uncharacterized repeat protein (TIGR02543 family)
MKKLINLLILFTTILSLTFIPAIPTNAASKVNITYYANNGYFKAKPNRSKSKITLKNKLNKKRGYAPSIRRDGYTFDGWYTKKKGGKKYSASTIIKKKLKLYPRWIKKYKINTNYFVPMGLSLTGVDDFQKYYGKLTITSQSVKKRVYPGKFNCKNERERHHHSSYAAASIHSSHNQSGEHCKNEKGDLIYISSWYGYDSDSYQIDYLNCKLKNVINIKKPTSMSTFFKKLGVKKYNYNSKTHTIDFICKKCYCNFHNDDAEYEDIWWTIKMNDKNQLTPDTIVNFQLITDWEVW